MSNWTHVAGIIRVDCLRMLGEPPWENFSKALGLIPYGSEGPLDVEVWENPNENHMAAYTVSIFGDLRDHDNPQSVVEWFMDVCNTFCSIRNAVITARNERNGAITWTWGVKDE